MKPNYRQFALAFLVFFVCLLVPCLPSAAPQPPAVNQPILSVDFLGAEQGYAIGTQSVILVCVVRNVGSQSLTENQARIRCYPVVGLEFMDGQLWPTIPALAPGQSIAFRWRLKPTKSDSPLVFSVLIQPSSKADANAQTIQPSASVTSVPHFLTTPSIGRGQAASVKPTSGVTKGLAYVGNDRVLVQVARTEDSLPVMALSAKVGGVWRTVGVTDLMSQVLSAEDGQTAWWENFKWLSTETKSSADSSELLLQGRVGLNWNIQLEIESRTGTGAMQCRLRLTARKNTRIYGVRLPRILARVRGANNRPKADGLGNYLPTDVPNLVDRPGIAPAHLPPITYGIAWMERMGQDGWTTKNQPMGDSDHLPILSGELTAGERGEVILSGASLEWKFRIFAAGPSNTIRDAIKFAYPNNEGNDAN